MVTFHPRTNDISIFCATTIRSVRRFFYKPPRVFHIRFSIPHLPPKKTNFSLSAPPTSRFFFQQTKMSFLDLIAVGIGLVFIGSIFVCMIAVRRRIGGHRETKSLKEEVRQDPWSLDYAHARVARLPPAAMGAQQVQYQYPPEYQQQWQQDVEKGHVWKH